ncbi:DUF1656 domain-containing protein [Sphingomonas kyeonggiensis]|jgi:hypothetical protein|uniref:DUF1656 domain-containing protein n=1 Tax=Sphingomonas kyeonggiensis TaxID=1268553 RepID=A0A7W6JZ55_9SPHN|nr:DUF1656 domain-containing protein [Sphingomonas kyeonggiensis]MBB4101117.1 hypothetical protein [Sphingomonas kyeonggiensis]
MIGEVSLDGVYLPTLFVLALGALALSFVLTRLIGAFGLYRFVAYRALVDLSLFVLSLGLLAFLVPFFGLRL